MSRNAIIQSEIQNVSNPTIIKILNQYFQHFSFRGFCQTYEGPKIYLKDTASRQ